MKRLKYKTNFAIALGMFCGFIAVSHAAQTANEPNDFLFKTKKGSTYYCKESSSQKGWLVSIDQCDGTKCVGRRALKNQNDKPKFETFKCTELSQLPANQKFENLVAFDEPLLKIPN